MADSRDLIDAKQYPGMLIKMRDPALTHDFDRVDIKFCYKMNHTNRGIAVIINNEVFTGNHMREGSQQDMECMEVVWRNLGFQVITHKNLTGEKMKSAFEDIGKRDHTENDCFVAVIMTHGGYNGIMYGTDYHGVNLTGLIKYLLPRNCPSLSGKPILFFVQACRGRNSDDGAEISKPNELKDEVRIPSWPNVLIHYSTVLGYYAYRNQHDGSWFIQSLGAILKDHSKQMELVQMLTMANRKVAYQYKSDTDGKKQMPTLSSSLTRQLYFVVPLTSD